MPRQQSYKEDPNWERKKYHDSEKSYKRDEDVATPGSRYRPRKLVSNHEEDKRDDDNFATAMTSEKLIITIQTGQGGSRKDDFVPQNPESLTMLT